MVQLHSFQAACNRQCETEMHMIIDASANTMQVPVACRLDNIQLQLFSAQAWYDALCHHRLSKLSKAWFLGKMVCGKPSILVDHPGCILPTTRLMMVSTDGKDSAVTS